MNPNFVFFGTPYFSVFVLEELAAKGCTPRLIVTNPDRPAGRGLALQETAVKKWATERNIRVVQPTSFDGAFLDVLHTQGASLAVVAAYGKILPKAVLDAFPKGALNVHPSLLPRYRGTSPVESQILADEKTIGVSIILMDEMTDHGPILAQEQLTVPHWPCSRTILNDLLWHAGGRLLADTLPRWLTGTLEPEPQDEAAATFTKKIKKEDGLLDLSADAHTNYLKYLAYEGWPGTYFHVTKNNKEVRVKITDATLSEKNSFRIERVIPEGKKEMSYTDFIK